MPSAMNKFESFHLMDIWKKLDFLFKDTKDFIMELIKLNLHLVDSINERKSKYNYRVEQTLTSVFYHHYISHYKTSTNTFFNNNAELMDNNVLIEVLSNLNS